MSSGSKGVMKVWRRRANSLWVTSSPLRSSVSIFCESWHMPWYPPSSPVCSRCPAWQRSSDCWKKYSKNFSSFGKKLNRGSPCSCAFLFLACLGVLFRPQLPGGSERPGQQILIRSRQNDVRGAVSSPTACDRQEDFRLLGNEIGLQFRCQHQVAEALALRCQGSEDPSAHAKVGRTHVRALLRAGQAQRQPPKIRSSHYAESIP